MIFVELTSDAWNAPANKNAAAVTRGNEKWIAKFDGVFSGWFYDVRDAVDALGKQFGAHTITYKDLHVNLLGGRVFRRKYGMWKEVAKGPLVVYLEDVPDAEDCMGHLDREYPDCDIVLKDRGELRYFQDILGVRVSGVWYGRREGPCRATERKVDSFTATSQWICYYKQELGGGDRYEGPRYSSAYLACKAHLNMFPLEDTMEDKKDKNPGMQLVTAKVTRVSREVVELAFLAPRGLTESEIKDWAETHSQLEREHSIHDSDEVVEVELGCDISWGDECVVYTEEDGEDITLGFAKRMLGDA